MPRLRLSGVARAELVTQGQESAGAPHPSCLGWPLERPFLSLLRVLFKVVSSIAARWFMESLTGTEDTAMGQETRMRGLSGGVWGLLGH